VKRCRLPTAPTTPTSSTRPPESFASPPWRRRTPRRLELSRRCGHPGLCRPQPAAGHCACSGQLAAQRASPGPDPAAARRHPCTHRPGGSIMRSPRNWARNAVCPFARAADPDQLLAHDGTGCRASVLDDHKGYLLHRWNAGWTRRRRADPGDPGPRVPRQLRPGPHLLSCRSLTSVA
jgi:hypothetical protein